MRRTLLVLLAIFVLGTAGVVGFLATWDIPAPSARVEKVIPNDRLPR